jgi:hypothetical protein
MFMVRGIESGPSRGSLPRKSVEFRTVLVLVQSGMAAASATSTSRRSTESPTMRSRILLSSSIFAAFLATPSLAASAAPPPPPATIKVVAKPAPPAHPHGNALPTAQRPGGALPARLHVGDTATHGEGTQHAAPLPAHFEVAALGDVSANRPVVVRLGVIGVASADAMDAALTDLGKLGATVEGRGFPMESFPPKGGRTVTVRTPEQATALRKVLENYPQAITRAKAEPRP